jgi:hypothetical protein
MSSGHLALHRGTTAFHRGSFDSGRFDGIGRTFDGFGFGDVGAGLDRVLFPFPGLHFVGNTLVNDCGRPNTFGNLRALLSFLDAHPALLDFFQKQPALFALLLSHLDSPGAFAPDCSFLLSF